MRHARKTAAAVALTAIVLCTAACSSGGSPQDGGAGSRATLYTSIDELAADSTAIVMGTVTDQYPDDDTTVSVVAVANTPRNPQLGANAPSTASTISVGDTVEVRQDAPSRPLLEVGEEYLLWLTPSMLPGSAASQFFITGSNAGMYLRDGDTAQRVATDSGDDLPATITIEGAPD